MSMKARILIVEDEAAIRTGLIDVFVYHGYDVDAAAEGPEGLRKALGEVYENLVQTVRGTGYRFSTKG